MNQYNAKNERIKRLYFSFQTEAKGKSQATLKGIIKAIHRFESYNQFKDFSTFNKEQAIGFKKFLTKHISEKSQEPLSKATTQTTLNHLKDFFQWIAYQPNYKSKIHIPDTEYFNLSEKEVSAAKAIKLKEFPSLEQIRKTVGIMPTATVINRRDRALLVFAILTGIRDAALASLRIKHINLNNVPILVTQNPDQVNTKFSKQIFTHFLPIGDDFIEIFKGWIAELKETLYYSPNDPLFPKTKIILSEQGFFEPDGLERTCWANAGPIRTIFKTAFTNAGLPYFSPHRFRDTLSHYGLEVCQTLEQFKAWSQSLGHSGTLTTLMSYGNLDPRRQGTVLSEISNSTKRIDPATMNELIRILQKSQQEQTYEKKSE